MNGLFCNSFCSIVIDGLFIAATTGGNLFETINTTAKKAITKIENYSQQQKKGCYKWQKDANVDLDSEYRRIYPLFKKYIINFKTQVDQTPCSSQTFTMQDNDALLPTTYNPWACTGYNQNYFLTKVDI